VDRGQRLEVGDRDPLVDLVDGRIDRPSSTTSRQIAAMNRPSEVPPVHDSRRGDAGDIPDRRLGGGDEATARVRYGCPEPVHARS